MNKSYNILYVEPYNASSHNEWITSYKNYSNHLIDVINLPSSNWKWRMHGGAITLANRLNRSKMNYDLIL